MHYLGRFGSPESRDEYRRRLSAYLAAVSTSHISDLEPASTSLSQSTSGPPSVTVNDIILAFMRHALAYYSVEGREYEQFKLVLRVLRQFCGGWSVEQFGPKALKQVR